MGKTSASVKNRYNAKTYDMLYVLVKKRRKRPLQGDSGKNGNVAVTAFCDCNRRIYFFPPVGRGEVKWQVPKLHLLVVEQ